jgi:hypothetical protein
VKKNPIMLAVLAAVVAFGGYYMVVLKPKRQEAADLAKKVDAKRDELSEAQKLLAANTAARETYRQAYSAVVRLGKAVPADDDVRSLVVQLDAAAKASHVDFRSINVGSSGTGAAASTNATAGSALPPGATVGPAGFPVMPFSFAFKGDFFNLGQFFQRLEKFVDERNAQLRVNGRLLTVDSLQLEPDSTGFPRIRATVGATSYLVSPLEGATAGAKPSGPAGATGSATPAAPGTATPAKPGSTSAPSTTTATSTGALR